MEVLFGLHERKDTTLLLVTHATEVAARCGRVVGLEDGRVVSDTAQAAPMVARR